MAQHYRGTPVPIRHSTIRSITEVAADLDSIPIRLSISALFRIRLQMEYLFIQSTRPAKSYFQPVGGVLKRDSKTPAIFRELQIEEDPLNGAKEDRDGDLRILLPAKNLGRFLDWYQSGAERESDYRREFLEELCAPGGYLPESLFQGMRYRQQGRFVSEITFIRENNRHQVFIAEICLPHFNPEQVHALNTLRGECRQGNHAKLLWASREEILAGRKGDKEIIESACWTLKD